MEITDKGETMTAKKDLPFPANMFATHKKGSMHRMLNVPKGEKIPRTFMQEIVDTPLGNIAHNPTQIGKPTIKVTHLVKARANGLLNAVRLRKKR